MTPITKSCIFCQKAGKLTEEHIWGEWTKQYVGRHRVDYRGINDGHGIWGVWEIRQLGGLYHDRGGFHIWPVAMGDPTQARLAESIEELTTIGVAPPVDPILAPEIPQEVAEPVSGGSPAESLSATRGR